MPNPSPNIPKPPPSPTLEWPECVVTYTGNDCLPMHTTHDGHELEWWSYTALTNWANALQLRLTFAHKNNGTVDS